MCILGGDTMKHQAIFGCLAALAATTAVAIAEDRDDSDRDDHVRKTPIKHLVVIFQENVSFDHYFGTYPKAQNNPGETPFKASPRTPKSVNTLLTPLDTTKDFVPLVGVDLINNNPNNNPNAPAAPNNGKQNGTGAANPFRLAPSQAATADQGHNEGPEESAYNNGLMDGFPAWVGTAGPPAAVGTKGLVMGYFDGNTVTALWNYAQHFALSDNSYTSQFGPSTPGALNLISGQANGFSKMKNVVDGMGNLLHPTHEAFDGPVHINGQITEIGDGDPLGDVCSNAAIDQVEMAGRNIGDELNTRGITWGWFEGGFDLTVVNPNGTTGCVRLTNPTVPGFASASTDYIPHHQPFQYYKSTSNPTHARPSSVAAIGHSFIPHTMTPEPANHQYDINDFFAALQAGNLPAVSFLKAPAFEDGHAGYSDPIDEQHFLVRVINALQKSPHWSNTAVIIAYDDSDGWYDHQMPPIVNPSSSPAVDTLNGPAMCNSGFQQGVSTPTKPLNGDFGMPAWGRCGYGTRMPLLVISPFAKKNIVDHTLTDQSSILRFIEDNWLFGERIQPNGSFDTIAGSLANMFDFSRVGEDEPRKVILDVKTGAIVEISGGDDDAARQ
jgi:phospholipase C